MSKPHSRVVDYLIYAVVRFVLAVVQALPFRAACRLAEGLAWLAYHLDRRHRLVALDNLQHAFPEMDDRARDRLVRGVYRHFCVLVVELSRLPRCMHATTWRRHLDLAGAERMVGHFTGKRPLLVVSGHFGNWEMGGYAMGLFGFQTYAVARTLDNPYLNDFLLHQFRQRSGQTILNKDGDFERIQTVLRGGGVLGTLADQDAGQRGQFVEFFGRPASTHKAVALLALEYDAIMLVIGNPRVGGPLEYQTIVGDVIDSREYHGRPDAVRLITERYTKALEGMVRQYPEQYFWLHRRWKHQPAQKKARKAAA
jgi:Kdo2-lipid IVA lauroyltransferase/acyltransferase